MVIAPAERLKLRRQMAAAAGTKSTTSLSLFMETFGLEVEDELSTMATPIGAEGVWLGKWFTEQKEAWLNRADVEASKRSSRSNDVRDT